ncbi:MULTISPECIES: HIT family protein [Oceanobacillus]|uniref:HIT family protein n=1 Tax=Oceanobacillus kimchii TaxID=746691 RepID=A0ABQ5TJB6_9BACI|nr:MULTISPECIES: HIT family protein [Oceanobacillus]MBT2598964.1 HIT family protein [Oceanobacillus sp. ISL-74]MBT2651883.1 HIT family protein [Oceanobacillus sp. ISL-73]OEH54416.1 HIT family hydrolase [Oceanobacillus sp. E9]GLO65728.1 HIT family protein [Oceanobacillus kimchii]
MIEKDCFICQKHKGDISASKFKIYENNYVYVGHIDNNNQQSYLGYIMIDLKRHIPTLGNMNVEESKAFGLIIASVSKALMECENAEHVYAIVSGDNVPHLHIHIIPRYLHTPKKFWGPSGVQDWPEAPRGNTQEILEICNRLKSYLENSTYE